MYQVEDIMGLFFWSNPFMLLHYSPAAVPTKPIRFFKTNLYKNQKSQKLNSKLNGETHIKPIQAPKSNHQLHVFRASLSSTAAPTMEGDQSEGPRWEPRANTNMDTAENAVKWDRTTNKEATDPPH